ncbi:hypothetical protein [Methylosinus sp. Sm6]|uniref:hypothetical protein n=1 Tax=Methylosinus sp. Sm6 TaxID=2866948 RepID=UPI001C9A0BA5|nr:hypothetical protein [Methylosinus sp. Sm6]
MFAESDARRNHDIGPLDERLPAVSTSLSITWRGAGGARRGLQPVDLLEDVRGKAA